MTFFQFCMLMGLCLLATAKGTIQSFFAKKGVQTSSDGLLLNGCIFLGALLPVLPGFITGVLREGISTRVVLFGLLTGFLSLLFQLTYLESMITGPLSLTTLLVNLAMLIPILWSVLIYHESFGLTRILGLLLTIAAFFLNLSPSGGKKIQKIWLFYVSLTFLINGSIAVVQRIYAREAVGSGSAYVTFTYLAAILCTLPFLWINRCRGEKITIRPSKRFFAFGLSSGVCLGTFFLLNNVVSAQVDGAVHYPVTDGGAIIMFTLVSILLYKEKLSPRRWIGTAVGIGAIVLMSL